LKIPGSFSKAKFTKILAILAQSDTQLGKELRRRHWDRSFNKEVAGRE
jgi:hypothetical protein